MLGLKDQNIADLQLKLSNKEMETCNLEFKCKDLES